MNTKEKLTEIIGNVVVNDKGNRIRDVFHPEFVEKIVDALVSTEAYRSLPKPTEWISVTDALPEEKVMVLGFSHTVFKDGGHYDLILVMELKNGLFVPFNCSPIKNGSVTHWMPLPQPPKGE